MRIPILYEVSYPLKASSIHYHRGLVWRLKCAWKVFTGKYDLVRIPE